ncbi:MAG: energy transducer TonB [Gemmatimonas sp.]
MRGTGIASSRPIALPPFNGAVASLLVHAGIIVGTLLLSAHLDSLPPDDDTSTVVKFLFPTLKPVPRPAMERVTFVGMSTSQPTAQPVQQGASAPKPPTEIPPPPRQVAVAEVHAPEPPKTFSEIEVDSAAIRDPDSAGPTYPPKLLALKLEGSTLAQFVVDSTGKVDVSSLVILDSTHPDFTQAVRDVLPRMKYQPARVGKRPVAQLVEQRFGFRIAPP